MIKKILAIIIFCVCCTLIATAQNSSFCIGESRYILKDKPNRFVTITPKSECLNIKQAQQTDSVIEANTVIRVYETKTEPYYVKAINDYTVLFDSNSTILPCYENQNGEELIPTNIVYLKLKDSTDKSILNSILHKYNLEIIDTISGLPLWYELKIVKFDGKTPNEITIAISQNEDVALCYPSFIGGGPEISHDAYSAYQWGLYNSENKGIDISVSEAWNYSTGYNTKIAIVDCGVDVKHEDLASNIWGCFDAYNGWSQDMIYPINNETDSTKFDITHGTRCAGIAAAIRNNGKDIVGVAPDAYLLSASINFFSSDVSKQICESIDWAWLRMGADVISCSWKLDYPDSAIVESIRKAIKFGRNGKGCIIVKSAGNNGRYITFPADSIQEIITVGNLMIDGQISEDSSIGENLFVCAPGTNILSTIPGNKVAYGTGTSFAAPYVAGVAALILSINPDLTLEQVRMIIARTAKKLDNYEFNVQKKYGSWNKYCGYGLIDAEAAVKMALKIKYPRYY